MTREQATRQGEAQQTARAVSYIRVSTKEQAERDGDPEGYSIPAQREANRRKAAALGAIVAAEFVDRGESARSADRPQLKEMLGFLLESPGISYVIVHKVDRLARNRMDDVTINLALNKAGVRLVSATENIDETPSGMLLHGIMSSIAEFYSRNLATEVIKGMSQKVKTGGTPGKPPLGYRNVRAINGDGREVRTIELDPNRAELIRWAFQAYATGDWTLTGMVTELELRGLTNPPTPKFPVRPVKANHLYSILTHPYYKGEVVWRGARYPGRHAKLVDDVTWAQVQTVLEAHGPGEKQRQHHHYLKSSVFCGGCSSRLIITHAKNRHGVVYPYFVCVGRHQKRSACTRKAVLISVVEERIEDFYAAVQLEPELREHVEALLTDELAATRARAATEQRDVQVQRQRLVNERSKLLQAHYAGAVPLDLLKTEQNRITTQLAAVEARLEATGVQFDTIQANLTAALDLAGDCHRAYLNAGDHTRRLMNQALFDGIYVEEDATRAELAEPFRTLLGPNVAQAAGRAGAIKEPQGQKQSETARTHTDPHVLTADEYGWSAAYIRRIRGRHTPRPHQNNKPAPGCYRGAGLKESTLVRSEGFEPPTS
ncbi:MAG: site-specific recombinase [Pseudonocardiales bacterium]|nr:site-specific recombinase [Pseudonocardiales bacterium]